jgi:hypothetical protein
VWQGEATREGVWQGGAREGHAAGDLARADNLLATGRLWSGLGRARRLWSGLDMAFESKLWRVKILFLLFAAKIHSYSCTLDFVHIKLKCLFVVLFLLFNCKELSVVVKISSYSSISDGVLRHIVQGKYSRLLMLMQIVVRSCK